MSAALSADRRPKTAAVLASGSSGLSSSAAFREGLSANRGVFLAIQRKIEPPPGKGKIASKKTYWLRFCTHAP
jgi:hypothetical protein